MGKEPTPVSIGKPAEPDGEIERVLGHSASGVMRLHLAVIDREDRLESGTGTWRAGFLGDSTQREAAAEGSVLRALRMASDATNFRILRSLSDGVGTPIEELAQTCDLERIALAERLADLVSAGLAAKIPEANQVAGVPAGVALVGLVERAAALAARDLARDH